MKIGIALPMFFNLPFSRIASASLRLYADGTGDIPVALDKGQRIAYLHLWPHARPFRLTQPEPALRCVPNAPRGRRDAEPRAARRGERTQRQSRPRSRPFAADARRETPGRTKPRRMIP